MFEEVLSCHNIVLKLSWYGCSLESNFNYLWSSISQKRKPQSSLVYQAKEQEVQRSLTQERYSLESILTNVLIVIKDSNKWAMSISMKERIRVDKSIFALIVTKNLINYPIWRSMRGYIQARSLLCVQTVANALVIILL